MDACAIKINSLLASIERIKNLTLQSYFRNFENGEKTMSILDSVEELIETELLTCLNEAKIVANEKYTEKKS